MSKHLPAGQGQTYRLFGGDIVTLKAVGHDTHNAYTVLETTTPPGAGPPPHLHLREDETFYVLAGEFEFTIAGQVVRAGAGDFLIANKGMPHYFRNVGQVDGKLLIYCHPAGFEHFVTDFAQISPDQPPDLPRMIAIGERHGIEFILGPSHP